MLEGFHFLLRINNSHFSIQGWHQSSAMRLQCLYLKHLASQLEKITDYCRVEFRKVTSLVYLNFYSLLAKDFWCNSWLYSKNYELYIGCHTVHAIPGEEKIVFQCTAPVSSLLEFPNVTLPRFNFLPNILCLPLTTQVTSQSMKFSLGTLNLHSPFTSIRCWFAYVCRDFASDVFLPIRLPNFFK